MDVIFNDTKANILQQVAERQREPLRRVSHDVSGNDVIYLVKMNEEDWRAYATKRSWQPVGVIFYPCFILCAFLLFFQK